MPLDAIFSIASALNLLGWLSLIVLPRNRMAHAIASIGIPLSIATLYLVLVVIYFPSAKGGFGSLNDVSLLFSDRAILLAGWLHYLAFDLFIGAWETRDSQAHRIPHFLVVPCLLLTLVLGPIGLLAYFVLRTLRGQTAKA